MAVASRTFIQLTQSVATNFGVLETGTLTASAATLLTSAAYPYKTNRSNANAKFYEGQEIYVTSGTATPNPNQVGTYSASAGTFVPGIDYSVVPSSTATFFILMEGLRSQWIQDAINKALTRLRYWSIYPITLVTDGNMESSATSDWTDTNATLSKVTTAANTPRGARTLFVNNTAADGQAQSATIPAAPVASTDGDYGGGAREYYAHAWVRADVGIAELVAYDVTNSAEIDSQTWDNERWGVIDFTFTLPATCEEFALILRGQGATADTYWTNIICHRLGAREMLVPDWVTRPEFIRDVYMGRYDLGLPDELMLDPVAATPMPDMGNANNLWRLDFVHKLTARPYWYMGSRPFAELSAASDTTTADREWLETAATMEMAKYMHQKYPKSEEWSDRYKFWFRETRKMSHQRVPGPKINRGRFDRFYWSSVT